MLNFFKNIFDSDSNVASNQPAPWHENTDIKNAVAALLIEVARADYVEEQAEKEQILELLQEYFKMDVREVEELFRRAETSVDNAIAFHPFTQVIRTELSSEHREKVIEMMWAVAFSDGVKDSNEEFLIRKVADLIRVPHPHFIRARRKVEALIQQAKSV